MSQRKTLLILILLLGLGVQQSQSVSAQQRPQSKSSKSSLDDEKKAAEIETFIGYAQSIAPEFCADLLIQLVESGQIKDPKRKQELLVEAFYTAAKAKEPAQLIGLPGSNVDTRAGYRVNAAGAGLDALSLQCRAIQALLQLNKQKARRLFEEIKFKLEPLSCSDAVIQDGTVFFTTVLAVARTGFSAEEMLRSEHVSFVESQLGKLSSPVEIDAAAKILISIPTTDLELMALGRALTASLKRIPSEYRSFSNGRRRPGDSVQKIVLTFSQHGLSSDELLEAYRTFVINQLSGSRCDDTGSSSEQRKFESDLVSYFNDTLRTTAYKKIAPISDDEIKPAKFDGRANTQEYWVSSKGEKLLDGIRQLRFGSKGKDLSDEDKQAAEWQSQLSEFVRQLADWGPEDEKSEEDFFHQKAIIYYALLPTIPAEAQYDGVRDEAFRDFTNMLSSSALQKDKPAEWFLHAKFLIDRVNKSQPPEREKLLNLIYSSRSTVLHLYVQKQQLFQATR